MHCHRDISLHDCTCHCSVIAHASSASGTQRHCAHAHHLAECLHIRGCAADYGTHARPPNICVQLKQTPYHHGSLSQPGERVCSGLQLQLQSGRVDIMSTQDAMPAFAPAY